MNWKPWAITAGIATATGYGFVKHIEKIQKDAALLEVTTNMQVHKIDLEGLVLKVTVKIKNPTNTFFKLKQPYIKLTYKDTIIGSSNLQDKDVYLNGLSESFFGLAISFPFKGMIGLAMELFTALTKPNGSIAVDVFTHTYVDVRLLRTYNILKNIEFSKTDKMVIKR